MGERGKREEGEGMPKVNGPGEGVGKLETRSDGINGDGMSPRMFPRLARVDSGLFGSGGGTVGGGSASSGSGVSAGTPRGAKGGKGGGGGDGGFSNLAEYLTKKLELQRTESDACGGSELSFGSSLSRDSSCGPFGDVPLPTGGVSGSSGKKGKGTSNSALSSLLYSRKLEGIEQRLKTVKEQTDEELENFTSDCRRALGSDSISEAEQFLYASLMEVAESVQALSLDDLRSNAQNSLEPSVNELQLLRHKSHGIEWSGQSPVMRLVIIVAKLSRVAEQFRPSESSPLSGIGLNPDAAADSGASTNLTMSAIPLRVFGVDIDMITSASRKAGDGSLENAHQQLSSDNLDNSDRDSERGSQDSMSRANSATGSPQQLSVRQGGGWNLPSQVLMLLPRALKKTVQMGGGVDEEVQTFLTIPMVPGADLAERWRARRRLNLKEDMVICRICEENQKLSQFEDHTNVCAKVAMSTQAIIQINQRLMKYAAKIDRRARENHSNGTKRSPKQVEKLTRLAEICVMPERNTLTREHLQFAYRQANTFDEFCLPGGLLTEEMIQEFVQEISIIIQQAEIMRDTLILGVAKRVRGELDNLLSAFKQLCDEGWKNVSEESKKRVEDDANINEKMSGNNAGRNRVGQLRRVIKAASLRNSPVLPSIDSGRNCLIPSITDFEILKPISRGAFGKVYLARKKTTGDIFAIKAISKTDMLRKNLVARVRAEKDILAGVANPFIVRFFWSFHSQSKLFLVMEYLTGGDMYSLLCNLGFLDEKVSRQYIGEIVLAIEYLHRMNIVHRDIKPDNILIGIDGHIKLTDFGLSRFGVLESNLFNDEVGESGVVGEKKSDGVKRVESVGSLCVEGANEAKEMVSPSTNKPGTKTRRK